MKNILKNCSTILKTFLALSLVSSSVATYGDDTEVFYSVNISKPNLLFVLDISGSMGDTLPGTNQSKLQIMKDSLRQVLADAPNNVKVGVMNYGQTTDSRRGSEIRRSYSVSGVAFPITDINAKAREIITDPAQVYGLPNYPNETITIREYIADIADSWNNWGWTPIVDSLYEAALYMRGEKIHYGQTIPTSSGAHPSTYDGNVVTTVMEDTGRDRANAPTYKTPIDSSCQDNYIVLMTDGSPTYNKSGYSSTRETPGPLARLANTPDGPQGPLAAALTSCSSPVGVGNAGKCGAELTHYIANNDNLPDPSDAFPDGQEGSQEIKTFAIGFGTNNDTNNYLKSLVTYDDGYYEATTPEDLSTAFKVILEEAAAPKGTLASPGYSVNVKNGLEHEDDIYIPVFDRKNTSRWTGNLKKFKLVNVNGKRLIRGKNDLNATDDLGNFTTDALDYWSDSTNADPDGNAVEKGGLANKLSNPANRKIYSNLSGDTNVVFTENSTVNRLSVANVENNSITNNDLGLATTATEDYRKTIVNFMLGWKDGDATSSDKEARYHMGDMLHSEPQVVTYNVGVEGDDNNNKVQYIFAGTNEGYLHAFDTVTGEEKFAFIPAELLSKLSEHQYLNAGDQADHKYGVDGVITVDAERDGAGNATKVIVYFGLRRGGDSFYALDVTNIDRPKLLWKRGKPDSASIPAGALDSMGQSWSAPYIAKIGSGASSTPVEAVFVSGGYDEDEDRDLPNSDQLDSSKIGLNVTADVGNNIFIFRAGNDASTAGDLLWSMPDTMRQRITSSIPGGLRILDTNYNGLIDRIYFADTGGNVWRLDLSETLSDSSTDSVLTKIASLGGTDVNNRMFYNETDVSTLKLNGKHAFGIAVGSGFRAHPMDEAITDRFYYIIDESPYEPLATSGDNAYEIIEEDDLATISLTNGVVTTSGSILTSRGWAINLPNTGEKVLGTSITFDGKVVFTSLVPEVFNNNPDQCAAPVTQARIYAFNVLTGKAALDLDGDGDIDDADFYSIPGTDIPGKPNRVFNTPVCTSVVDSSGNSKLKCVHDVDIRVGKKADQVTNSDSSKLESVYWSDPVKEE